jgi:hypothetical protein
MPVTERLRSMGATSVLALLVAVVAVPATAAPPRELAGALPPGHPSCHARVFDAAEQAAHPERRVTSIAFVRTAGDLATERKWGKVEQFDDTPVVSMTLRVRLRGDPAPHSARLECVESDDGALVCTSPVCDGGELHVAGEGKATLAVSLGGALKSGRFIGHYIHLDDSCEGRAGGPIVLESGNDDRLFSVPPAPSEACR